MEAGEMPQRWTWREHAKSAEKGVRVDKIHLGVDAQIFLSEEEAESGSCWDWRGKPVMPLRLLHCLPFLSLRPLASSELSLALVLHLGPFRSPCPCW